MLCADTSSSLPLQYYVEVLGDDVGSLFNAEYGILVSDGLHHPFDRGEWALWPDVSGSGQQRGDL